MRRVMSMRDRNFLGVVVAEAEGEGGGCHRVVCFGVGLVVWSKVVGEKVEGRSSDSFIGSPSCAQSTLLGSDSLVNSGLNDVGAAARGW